MYGKARTVPLSIDVMIHLLPYASSRKVLAAARHVQVVLLQQDTVAARCLKMLHMDNLELKLFTALRHIDSRKTHRTRSHARCHAIDRINFSRLLKR